MMRMMRGRWFWGLMGAAATMYFVRRYQSGRRARLAPVNGLSSAEAYEMGQNVWQAVVDAGRAIAESTARAVARSKGR